MKSLSTYLENPVLPENSVFTIIKPGFLKYSQPIIQWFEEAGWRIHKLRTTTLTLSQAHALYKVHKDKDFYEGLCEYMSSGPSMAIIYTYSGVPDGGLFEAAAKIKDGIRKKWGVDDCRNVLHSSDSMEAMKKESAVYF